MEFHAVIPPMSRAVVTEQLPSSSSSPLNEDAMWQMSVRTNETMETGPYPERPGEVDCSYYMRTGLCRFGETCRYNHPPNRKMVIANAKMKGELPERSGQPECQYYLKTGTCKFGGTCKFHHPRDKAGIAGRVSFNNLGYPLRPNEIECAYYLRTGECKFGSTCKFHHPQPSNMSMNMNMMAASSSSSRPGAYSLGGGGGGGIVNWPLSFIPSPRRQGVVGSSFAPLILSPQGGVVSIPGWSTEYGSGSVSGGGYAFPERVGQPECQFYMKTGDCKFGAVCRFHHPRDRVVPHPDCVLSPIGLPSRPGEPFCIFYSRYGICKFGPSCKFDHPMGIFTFNLSGTTSSTHAPTTSGPAASDLANPTPRDDDDDDNNNNNAPEN